MTYVLDTDIWSYFLRDLQGVRRRVLARESDELAMTRVTAAELEVLALRTKSKSTREGVRALRRRARFLEVEATVWQMYPQVRAALLGRGRTVGLADVLIGCCAALHGAVVVSNNETHFAPICEVLGLELENWAAQE